MLAHLNNLLPASHQIDPAYVKAVATKGFSEALQQHVVFDRLEARLRTLDKVGYMDMSASAAHPSPKTLLTPRFTEEGW